MALRSARHPRALFFITVVTGVITMSASISNTLARARSTFALRRAAALACSLALMAPLVPTTVQAHGIDASTASSALSLLPVAVSVAAPVALLVGGATLSVVAVEASARGTVLFLERASDASRMSLELAGQASLAVGTVVAVTAVSTGWVLSQAGKAVLFIPNEIGASLLYNERITP
jgi:hypothetical protein